MNPSPRSLTVAVPGKINLHLRVGPRREDGFHPLLSWMCRVGLFDTLMMQWQAQPAGVNVDEPVRIEMECDLPELPCDGRNLVVRIAQAWARQVLVDQPRAPVMGLLQVRLHKRIPLGAGLGGGSSDAASALLGVNELWDSRQPVERLSEFAARFGSDISFFFHGPSSVCRGRGEVVRPIGAPLPGWVVLMLPGLHMPTPEVYRRFDAMGLGRTQDVTDDPDWPAWTKLPARELMPLLVNDLEAPAFDLSPALAELRRAAERIAGRPVRMSGSGSTLFTLFDEPAEAEQAAGRLSELCAPAGRALAVATAPPLDGRG